MKIAYSLGALAIIIAAHSANAQSGDRVPEPSGVQRENNGRDPAVVGIDHIGINVPDIDAATIFLERAFDAVVIYESYSKQQPPIDLTGRENTLNVAPGTKIHAARMIKIGNGPTVELFEVRAAAQQGAARSSDFGLQHLAFYTDDMAKSIARFVSAGGKILSDPQPILFEDEKGARNFFCYGVAPWGTSIEFITYPDKMPYESHSRLRRWKAGRADD